MKLSNRYGYKPFIRAITSAIAMAVTGRNRWTKAKTSTDRLKFWDLRPFTRVIYGFKAFLSLKDYILLNELEGFGVQRNLAKMIIDHQGPKWAEVL